MTECIPHRGVTTRHGMHVHWALDTACHAWLPGLAGWLHATSTLPNTAHHHPSPATIERATGQQKQHHLLSAALPLTLPPPLRSAPPSTSTACQACVSTARLARLTSRPYSLPLRLHTHQAAFHIKLDLRPSTPPSQAHTLPTTHQQHLRLPPPPCRGSSPRVRRRQCRPDLRI